MPSPLPPAQPHSAAATASTPTATSLLRRHTTAVANMQRKLPGKQKMEWYRHSITQRPGSKILRARGLRGGRRRISPSSQATGMEQRVLSKKWYYADEVQMSRPSISSPLPFILAVPTVPSPASLPPLATSLLSSLSFYQNSRTALLMSRQAAPTTNTSPGSSSPLSGTYSLSETGMYSVADECRWSSSTTYSSKNETATRTILSMVCVFYFQLPYVAATMSMVPAWMPLLWNPELMLWPAVDNTSDNWHRPCLANHS